MPCWEGEKGWLDLGHLDGLTLFLRPHKHFKMSNFDQNRVFTLSLEWSDTCIALDKAAYCIFTQLLEPENAIKFISVHTKTQ